MGGSVTRKGGAAVTCAVTRSSVTGQPPRAGSAAEGRSGMADQVSLRLIQAWRAVVVERLTPTQAIAKYDFRSPQLFNKYVQKLVERGYIYRRQDIPEWVAWADTYPYEPTGKPMVYYPPPPDARLRVTWPAESQGDLTVPTIRAAQWGRWLVQGVPILRLDGSAGRSGRPPDDKIPNLRVVVISDTEALADPPDPEDGLAFLASVRDRWRESDTRLQVPVSVEPDSVSMTRVIACVLGVEAVIDVSLQAPVGE
jgi:hypothetical protein